jgi:hypothetical protein
MGILEAALYMLAKSVQFYSDFAEKTQDWVYSAGGGEILRVAQDDSIKARKIQSLASKEQIKRSQARRMTLKTRMMYRREKSGVLSGGEFVAQAYDGEN